LRKLTLTSVAAVVALSLSGFNGQVSTQEVPLNTKVTVLSGDHYRQRVPAREVLSPHPMPDVTGVDFTHLLRSVYGACGEWYPLAMEIGWPKEEWKKLNKVIARETGRTCLPDLLNDSAQTRDRSWGLMQINTRGQRLWEDRKNLCGLSAPEELFDPRVNLTCGLRLWERSGWGPWTPGDYS